MNVFKYMGYSIFLVFLLVFICQNVLNYTVNNSYLVKPVYDGLKPDVGSKRSCSTRRQVLTSRLGFTRKCVHVNISVFGICNIVCSNESLLKISNMYV